MTEAEWLSHGDYPRFLYSLIEMGSERQLRLFACGCCRRVWRWMTDEASREAVEVAEQLADRKANRSARKQAEDAARIVRAEANDANDWPRFNAASCAFYTIRHANRELLAGDVIPDTTQAACYVVELGEGGKREDELVHCQALILG